MIPTFDWLHGLALALGALAAVFFPKISGNASGPTASPATTGAHPLFETLIKVLESKLADLIHVEPGPNGEPMFTIRVVMAPDEAKK